MSIRKGKTPSDKKETNLTEKTCSTKTPGKNPALAANRGLLIITKLPNILEPKLERKLELQWWDLSKGQSGIHTATRKSGVFKGILKKGNKNLTKQERELISSVRGLLSRKGRWLKNN